MHKNCCKTRYNIKHICNTTCDDETHIKTSFKTDKYECENLKCKYEDLIFFGSILQIQLLAFVFMIFGYIMKDLFRSCIQSTQQNTSCFSSRHSFKNGLETSSCSRYYFNLLVAYDFIFLNTHF